MRAGCWSRPPGTTDIARSRAKPCQRRQGQPPRVIALADRAQERLCRRYRHLLERGKPPQKVVVAIARELVGFLWAALVPATVVEHSNGRTQHHDS